MGKSILGASATFAALILFIWRRQSSSQVDRRAVIAKDIAPQIVYNTCLPSPATTRWKQ